MLELTRRLVPPPEFEANLNAIVRIYIAEDGKRCRARWEIKRDKDRGLHAEWKLSGCESKTIVVRSRLNLYKMPRNIRERIALWLEAHKSGSS